MANSSKKPALENVASQIKTCKLCQLGNCRINAVPGSGNPDSGILIVGEAPGRFEDESGLPFVGMAGKFLDKLLERAGLTRDDVFITNVVKCRPPSNRAPESAEIKACASFLQEQIRLLDPRLVICLGSTASLALLGIKQLTKERGKLIERDGRFYVVAIHPAARFRRVAVAEDFDKLRELLPLVPGLKIGKPLAK